MYKKAFDLCRHKIDLLAQQQESAGYSVSRLQGYIYDTIYDIYIYIYIIVSYPFIYCIYVCFAASASSTLAGAFGALPTVVDSFMDVCVWGLGRQLMQQSIHNYM